MMGEHPDNDWWSLKGKLQSQPSDQGYSPTFLATPPLPLPAPQSSILNPPYLFGSSLLAAAANPNSLVDYHHNENQDFPVISWSQSLLNGLTNDQELHNLGAEYVGHEVIKHAYDQENQQSRQLYYSNKNKEDLQACSSSWSSQLNPVPSFCSSSTLSLNNTMFGFSRKIINTNQFSSQYDDISNSGASKKPRFQSSSNSQSSSKCNGIFTSGTSERTGVQHSLTQIRQKVRKEQSGRDKISALHQLVSPFGKTDTTSVLYEATVQIKFFMCQIEALSSSYMNLVDNVSGGMRHQHSADGEGQPKDLSSRGLCLVPVTCMDHIDTSYKYD